MPHCLASIITHLTSNCGGADINSTYRQCLHWESWRHMMCWKRHIWRKRRLFYFSLPCNSVLSNGAYFAFLLPCNSVLVQRRLDANLTNSNTDKGSAHLLHQRSMWYISYSYSWSHTTIMIAVTILMITHHHHHHYHHHHASSLSYSRSQAISIIISHRLDKVVRG